MGPARSRWRGVAAAERHARQPCSSARTWRGQRERKRKRHCTMAGDVPSSPSAAPKTVGSRRTHLVRKIGRAARQQRERVRGQARRRARSLGRGGRQAGHHAHAGCRRAARVHAFPASARRIGSRNGAPHDDTTEPERDAGRKRSSGVQPLRTVDIRPVTRCATLPHAPQRALWKPNRTPTLWNPCCQEPGRAPGASDTAVCPRAQLSRAAPRTPTQRAHRLPGA